MHLKRVIPCLDVDAGRVVKGTNFVDIRDAGDPVELAERYDREGADELIFLDITATSDKRATVVAKETTALKQAWVKVLAGKNEGKDFILSRPMNILGRDERCDVPLYGDMNVAPQQKTVSCLVVATIAIRTNMGGFQRRKCPLLRDSTSPLVDVRHENPEGSLS